MNQRNHHLAAGKPPTKQWGVMVVFTLFLAMSQLATAQKIGYVSTDMVKSKYVPAMQAEERLAQTVEGWKAELDQFRRDIDDLELEMKKNRLIWSDQEREQKQREMDDRKRQRDKFAREKFEPGGDYDKMADDLYTEIWEKIHLAIQKVAGEDGYDIVWDKSSQPLVYVNAKYDLTVKVMKELDIDADELERKQLEVIDADPRNQRQKEERSRRSRRRSTSREVVSEPNADDPTPAQPSDGMTPNNLPPVPLPVETAPPSTKEEDIPR